MRFLIPAQTFSEYQHRRMPVYETVAAIGATTIVGSLTVGGLAASAATAGAGALAAYGVNKLMNGGSGGGGSGGGMPSFNPQQALALEQQQYNQMANQAQGYASNLFNQASQQGQQFANQGTAQNIRLQNKVTPGSSAQREQALQQINSYIQGQVPQDVQQNINRQVAQNLGGGFNLFSGGGQAPANFARNIGQTSLGLSQFGLSAAPTWQQLANTMVVSPQVGLAAGLQAGSIGSQLAGYAAGQGNQLAENQYQSGFNQYAGQQQQNQQGMQMVMQGANFGNKLLDSANTGGYFSNIAKGAQSTLGGIPAYSNQFGSDQKSSYGFYETPQAAQSAGINNPQFCGQGANTGFY